MLTWNGEDYRPLVLKLITQMNLQPFESKNTSLKIPVPLAQSLCTCCAKLFRFLTVKVVEKPTSFLSAPKIQSSLKLLSNLDSAIINIMN